MINDFENFDYYFGSYFDIFLLKGNILKYSQICFKAS